jgi:hypothetical protein
MGIRADDSRMPNTSHGEQVSSTVVVSWSHRKYSEIFILRKSFIINTCFVFKNFFLKITEETSGKPMAKIPRQCLKTETSELLTRRSRGSKGKHLIEVVTVTSRNEVPQWVTVSLLNTEQSRLVNCSIW